MAESELLRNSNAARPVRRRVNDIDESSVVFDVDGNTTPRPSSRKKIKISTSSNTPQSSGIQNPQKYRKPTGLQKSYHGVAYQVQWMMVVALEAQARLKDISGTFEFKTKDFKTEDPDAGKFDDLVWRYETDQPNSYECNFLQAKHILNKEKKITLEQLLRPKQQKNSLNSNKKDKRPFALEKYFLSYRDELKIKYIQNGKINKLIIATNIDFNNDLKSCFDQLQDDIPILDFIQKETGNFKFKKDNFPHQKIIKEELKNTYDLIKIAKDLRKCVLTNEPLKKDSTLISYWSALEKNRVIKPSRKFHSHFIENHQHLSKEAKQLREVFFQEAFTNTRESLGFNVNYEISNSKELAEEIASKIIQSYKDSKNNVTIYTSQKVQNSCIKDLAGYVLVEKNGEVRFNSKFWTLKDNELPSDNLKSFRDELKSQFKSQINNTKNHKLEILKKEQLDVIINKFQEYKFNIGNKDNFKTCNEMLVDEDSFWMSVASFEFNDFERPNLDRSISKLPSHELKDIEEDINNFFNQLVFVVNCSQEMLNEFIKEKCSWFVGLETDYVAFEFQSKIADALNLKAKEFISTTVDVSQFFDNAKQQIARLILIGPSLVYCAEIKEFGIIFKKEAIMELSKFLTSENQILIVVNKENKLSSIKVLQMLECMHEYQKDGSYIFIRLISLLHLHDCVIKAFESKISNNLLIIECEVVEINLHKLFYQLLQVINFNNKKKIIFITQENDPLADKFKDNFSNYDWYKDEKNSLIDLTYDSQKKLLKKGKAIFQGKKVSLDPLIDKESKPLINGELLCKIINNEMIEIGKAFTDSMYDDVKDYYIDRTFHRQVKIREDYKNEKSKFLETKSSEINEQELIHYDDILLISDTCETFKELCIKYQQHNIHWLMDETNDLIWKKSYGSLSSLRKILDTYEQSVQEYKPEKITDIPDRVIILTAEPGMGKSFVLNHLALKTKESDSSLWVMRINLIDCSTELEREIKKNKKIDEADAIKFLYKVVGFQLLNKKNKKRKEKMIEKILSAIIIQDGKISMKFHGEEIHDSNLLEIRIFNNFYNQGRVTLLFDGFDEICPDYEEKTIELLQALKNTKVKKLWITSRRATRELLEDELGVLSYSLKAFLAEEQNSFLKKFWKAKLGFRELDEQRAVIFINQLQNKLPESIDFMSIPLHAYMVAEVFKDAFKDFYDSNEQNMSDECKQKIEKQDLVILYDKFFYNKFHEIRFGEKKPEINNSEVDMKNMIEGVYENSIRNHRILALYALFNNNEVKKLTSLEERKEASKFINDVKLCNEKTGIIEQVVINKPSFVHRTFAEYFVSSYFWEKFKSVEKYYENFIEVFIINNLIKDNRIQISRFLQLEAKKDFESNINLPFMQDKLKILFAKLLEQTKEYDLKKKNKQSTKLLFGIIEFSELIHNECDDLDVEENDRLKLLCLSAEMGYIKLANAIGTKLTETYLKNYLKIDKWYFSPLWLATKNAHKNVVQFLVENFSYSAYWEDKDNAILIVRIFQRGNFNVLRSCLKFNILNGKPYIDENNKESLPILKALDSIAPPDVIKLLIEKMDSDHAKAVPYNSDTIFSMIISLHKYDKEMTELFVKKGFNFSEAINLLIFEFICSSLYNPVMQLKCASFSQPGFHSEQEFLSLFEKIELLLKCGIGYNRLSRKETHVTTLQYAEQIYYIHKLLEGVYKLHKQNNDKSKSPIDTVLKLIINCISGSSDFKGYDIDKPSNINLVFSRNLGINENVSLLPSKLLQELGLNEKINTNLIENSLNKLRSYISNAKEEIEQFKMYRDSKTYNNILIGYEEMFQYSYYPISNKKKKEERFKSLDPFVKGWLKRVLNFYIFQDYEIDDALEELSDEVLKFSNIIDRQKKSAHLKESIKTENILIILALKSIDTNENLQHLIFKIHDSYGISVLLTAWSYLCFIGKKRIMGILELMFKFSDQSLKVFELLKKLDSSYKTLTKAIENKNYEEVNNILQDIKSDHFIKAIINGQDDKFGSPLHYAAFKGDLITTQILLKYGVNPNLKLMENSELLCITEETEENYDLIGKTSLDLATKYGHKEVANILLSHGADNTWD